MTLGGKLVSEIKINAAAEDYYKKFKHDPKDIPNVSPIFDNVEHHDGDWDTHGHGSIKTWNYTLDGKAEVFKERVEFDDKKMAITLTGLEGDVFNHYKTFNATYQVIPAGPKHCSALLTLEYEKLTEDSPYPYKYLDIMNNLTKDLESHLN